MKPDCALDGSIPVFVFPSAINFYLEDYSSHKQVLTIYNPYEFPLRFKVLCTDPRKYNVIDPEGCIKRGCCIDIVIRLVAVNPAYLNRVDTFRIQMLDQGSKQILGKRDVLATFFPGGSPESAKHPQAENEDFKSLQGVGSIGSSLPGDRSRQSQHKQGRAVESRSQGILGRGKFPAHTSSSFYDFHVGFSN
ncbi:motile sperm domain-containing protein 1-like isoform X3 [Ischnura elegans]|uniref:motile sperm domain-containing protein 1-like isoform X3 n=1 Tax=Ischnura elegans TaxID=197161 RepID=UPI001ED8B806|nr:motile sperm domain-containing protein 1-like isoform X3 [Ischnura elegans]